MPADAEIPARAPAPELDYAYTHDRTQGGTGYFACEPVPEPTLDAALDLAEQAPLDDFLHEHLLRRLGGLTASELRDLAARCQAAPATTDAAPAPVLADNARASASAPGRPALAVLLLEAARIFPDAAAMLAPCEDAPCEDALWQAAAPLLARGVSARLLPAVQERSTPSAGARPSAEPGAPDRGRGRMRVRQAWAELYRANLRDHRPLPRFDETGLPPLWDTALLAEAAAALRPDADCGAPASIPGLWAAAGGRRSGADRQPEPGAEGGALKAMHARALAALERADLLAGPEMRHEASLSPIALLRQWKLELRVRNGRNRHTLRGTPTAYGRGLSLARARVSCIMEVVERVSAYAGVDCAADGSGMVCGRRSPLPLLRASIASLRKAGTAFALPGIREQEQNAASLPPAWAAPLHWLEARTPQGERVLVPAQAALLFCNLDEPCLTGLPGSTGLASGATMVEATLSALMECIERDADATTPFSRHSCFTLASRDARLQGLLDDYAARGIRVQFQDITGELGVPVYRAFVTGVDGTVAGATGAGLNGAAAALAALTETPWPYSWATPAPFGVASGPGLSGLPVRMLEDLPDWSLPTPDAALALLEAALAARGLTPLAVDLTRADLDVPVVRVLVPGLEPHADFDALFPPAPRLLARHAQRDGAL